MNAETMQGADSAREADMPTLSPEELDKNLREILDAGTRI